MDLYVRNFVGSSGNHGDFYTNPAIRSQYKKIVKAIVSRYIGNPAIMAWELANEVSIINTFLQIPTVISYHLPFHPYLYYRDWLNMFVLGTKIAALF